ncbi:MAG: hypothetical protein JRH20_10885 [Deltaproteobacteria bacterium]|nr:hypothetical protein [Deltaproteobacteria bacterium]
MLEKRDFLYDSRLVERFISRGAVTRKEYDAHLAKLPDAADKSEPLVPENEELGGANDD